MRRDKTESTGEEIKFYATMSDKNGVGMAMVTAENSIAVGF